jgi:hypothetical protein
MRGHKTESTALPLLFIVFSSLVGELRAFMLRTHSSSQVAVFTFHIRF